MKIFLACALVFSAFHLVPAQTPQASLSPKMTPKIIRVDARPDKGFSYAYYIYVPDKLRDKSEQKKTHTFLVLPNNTGKISDDMGVHDAYVKKEMNNWRGVADRIGVALLMPVFPRSETNWRIYTHALDRDSLLTDKKEFSRFDLQLIAMIDHARAGLKKEKLKFGPRVLMNGFSASGMFTNRFVFLHPDRVKAAVIGSPGGWPIAPADAYKEKMLRYPIGTGDMKTVSGKKLDLKTLRKVPLFLLLGDKDDNDSVPFSDGYDEEDKVLIFELFGKTPVERWPVSQSLYQQSGLDAVFKLYPGIGHMTNREINNEIYDFLGKYAK